jgi:hypothetical protein
MTSSPRDHPDRGSTQAAQGDVHPNTPQDLPIPLLPIANTHTADVPPSTNNSQELNDG